MTVSRKTATPNKKATRITVSLTEGDHTALAGLAERCSVSLSWVTRQAILEFLENHGTGDVQLPLDLNPKRKSRHD